MDLQGKRLVILGCGYIGAAVARRARAAGLQVDALTRNPARAAELAELGVNPVVADLATDAWHERIVPGADLVVNCVSAGSGGLGGYRRSYVDGMRSLVAWARQSPVGTVVYTSSTSVYPQSGGVVVDETAQTEGASETGRILLEGEAVLRGAAGGCGRWFILRLGGIYGPGRHHLLDQVRAGTAEMAGDGSHHLNLAHRDDISMAVLAVLASLPALHEEIFNVVDDTPAPKAEVVKWLAVQTGQPAPRFSGGSASARRGFSTPPDRLISNARLKAALGWRPQYPSFREGYAAILSA
jgi:nucleoside-diphosphate-sugar epimerase